MNSNGTGSVKIDSGSSPSFSPDGTQIAYGKRLGAYWDVYVANQDGSGGIRKITNNTTDPNFTGAGRALTDKDGNYRFITIRPGEYPWRNHPNAWRPAHIHFSLFGQAFLTRMVTQMYFPGDPLLPYDPMFTCIENEAARNRLVSVFDWESTIPEQALGYRFDIVLRGPEETPLEKMP